MVILFLQNIPALENVPNNGRIPHTLLSENYPNLPGNLTLLYKFGKIIDGFIPNFVVFYMLNYISNAKQLKTISIII
jgi:hypothetical protein